MITPIKAILCTCERCDAKKVYPADAPPVCCWSCKSAYWNQPRRQPKQEDDLNSGDYDYMNRNGD